MNKSEKTLIIKDIKETTSSKQIVLPMVIVPLMMSVLLPTIMIIVSYFAAGSEDVLKDMEPLLKNLPIDYKQYTSGQLVIYTAVNYMFPSFFLIIPIMASGILGASSFVGEKEHKTMETLLYTPISMEQLLRAKIVGVFIPAYIVTLLSFVAFGIVINVGGIIHFAQLIFPNLKWLIIILWLAPSVTLFSLTFTVLVSAKSSTFQDAQQVSGLLVIPVVLLLVGQMTGLFLLNNVVAIAIGAVLFIVDFVMIRRISRRFVAEKLI
jgi:ABC-type Na+ efflux pump permease subunit